MPTSVAVVVGILRNQDGCYWVGQRPASSRYPGKWEFPGGKVETGESPQQALLRELQEELGIEATIGEMIMENVVEYPDGGRFTLQFFLIESWIGTPSARVFADQAWVSPAQLAQMDLLEGSKPVCALLMHL